MNSSNPMQKHMTFLEGELLPTVAQHARRIGCTPDEAALASVIALSSILFDRGMPADVLMAAIQEIGALPTCGAPEGLQ